MTTLAKTWNRYFHSHAEKLHAAGAVQVRVEWLRIVGRDANHKIVGEPVTYPTRYREMLGQRVDICVECEMHRASCPDCGAQHSPANVPGFHLCHPGRNG